MPSIKDAIQKNAQRIAAGEQLVQPVPKDVGPASADGPFVAPASPVVTGLPVRGVYTPNLTLHTDFQNNTQGLRTGPNIRSATFPSPQTSSSSIVSKIVTAATAAVSSLIIKVNNALAPNQKLINILEGTGMIITVDAAGNIVFNSTSSGDGLTHGSLPWEIDPSSFILQDDFFSCQLAAVTSAPTAGIGQLGWRIVNTNGLSTSGGYAQSVGNPLGLQGTPVGNSPAGMGCFVMSPTAVAQQGGLLMMNWSNGGYGALAAGSGAWPLLDNPGWKCTWVFKHDVSHAPTATVYTPAGHSTYVGLFGPNEATQMNSGTNTSRPSVFCGVRFDSSGYYPSTFTSYGSCTAVTMTGSNMAITGTFTGANTTAGTSWIGLTFVTSGFGNSANNGTFICTAATTTTLTLTNANGVNATVQTGTVKSNTPCICTAVANASAGNTTYTGAFPNVGNLKGQQVTISGFSHAANNGTFTIVSQSSGTTLVVNNPSGVAETHAGYIAGLGIFDSTYVLEYVVNTSTAASSTRNNLQGQTSALAVGPAVPGVWYRLDITCTSSSQMTITLSGNGTTNSLIVNTSKYTQVFNGSFGLNATLVGLTGNPNYLNILELSSSDSFPFNANFPVAIGGSVTIAGLTGAGVPMNGTWSVLPATQYGSTFNIQLGGLNHAPIGSQQQTGAGISVSGYPGFTPGAFHGVDISTPLIGDSQNLWLDYFGFAWNPALSANAPGTPDSTKARYW